eukprot:2766327-Rhodomonas_salina.1
MFACAEPPAFSKKLAVAWHATWSILLAQPETERTRPSLVMSHAENLSAGGDRQVLFVLPSDTSTCSIVEVRRSLRQVAAQEKLLSCMPERQRACGDEDHGAVKAHLWDVVLDGEGVEVGSLLGGRALD